MTNEVGGECVTKVAEVGGGCMPPRVATGDSNGDTSEFRDPRSCCRFWALDKRVAIEEFRSSLGASLTPFSRSLRMGATPPSRSKLWSSLRELLAVETAVGVGRSGPFSSLDAPFLK